MPQAVIDTNVLVRAILRSTGSDRAIFEAFKKGEFELLYSKILLREITRVLNYPRIFTKYNLDNHALVKFINTIVTFGKLVYSPKKVKICRDPKDDEILSIALSALRNGQVYVVSGDKDLLELKGKVEGVKILTASDFLKILR